MKLNLTSSCNFPSTTGGIGRNAVKVFIDALPEDSKLSIRTYQGDQREQTTGGITITATWSEER